MSVLATDVLESRLALRPPRFMDADGSREIGIFCFGWARFNFTTMTVKDSFNLDSLTDLGTGQVQCNWTNDSPNKQFGTLITCLPTKNGAFYVNKFASTFVASYSRAYFHTEASIYADPDDVSVSSWVHAHGTPST